MGWSSYPNTVKQDIVNKIITNRYWADGVEVVKHSLRGRQLWLLLMSIEKNGGQQYFISLALVESDRRDRTVNVKHISESCGPAYYNCPLSFIMQASPVEPGSFADKWRKEVMEYHKSRKKASSNYIPEGARIANDNQTFELQGKHSKGWRLAIDVDTAMTFRISTRTLNEFVRQGKVTLPGRKTSNRVVHANDNYESPVCARRES